jgi:hypothetical protein
MTARGARNHTHVHDGAGLERTRAVTTSTTRHEAARDISHHHEEGGGTVTTTNTTAAAARTGPVIREWWGTVPPPLLVGHERHRPRETHGRRTGDARETHGRRTGDARERRLLHRLLYGGASHDGPCTGRPCARARTGPLLPGPGPCMLMAPPSHPPLEPDTPLPVRVSHVSVTNMRCCLVTAFVTAFATAL